MLVEFASLDELPPVAALAAAAIVFDTSESRILPAAEGEGAEVCACNCRSFDVCCLEASFDSANGCARVGTVKMLTGAWSVCCELIDATALCNSGCCHELTCRPKQRIAMDKTIGMDILGFNFFLAHISQTNLTQLFRCFQLAPEICRYYQSGSPL